MKSIAQDIPTRTITITAKSTSANTQYWNMSKEDTAYIYNWLIQYQSQMCECVTHSKELREEFFKRQPISVFPKGQLGPNSYASMVGGLISAYQSNPNKNFSTPQLESLEKIFDAIEDFYNGSQTPAARVTFQKSIIAAPSTEAMSKANETVRAILDKRSPPVLK